VTGSGERPVQADVAGGRGVQAGSGNAQVNVLGLQESGSGKRQDIRAARDAVVAGRDFHYHAAAAGPQVAPASGPLLVGDVPAQPPGFQPRAELLAARDPSGPGASVVHAVTGMRGVGKTQLAAAYARSKLVAGWRLVAWVNAEDAAVLAAGLAAVAKAAGLSGRDSDPGLGVRHWLETDGERCLVLQQQFVTCLCVAW
jgi:hypothetical protein